jgi:hypothetical protein
VTVDRSPELVNFKSEAFERRMSAWISPHAASHALTREYVGWDYWSELVIVGIGWVDLSFKTIPGKW